MFGLVRAASAAVLALACVAAPAAAAPFSELYVFGDSLVDAGNVRSRFPTAANPNLGYFQGRFTNGPDYTDLLRNRFLGGFTTASELGGTNYAWGGARVIETAGNGVPDLILQVSDYLGDVGGVADMSGLYVINMGGNDIFALESGSGVVNGVDGATYSLALGQTVQDQVERLSQAGARNILVTGIPNATSPIAPAVESILQRALDEAELVPGTTLFRFSYFNFFGALAADPTRFGLPADLNTTTPCLAARTPSPNIDCVGFFSFDGIHPTAAIHVALAQEVAEVLGVPVPAALTLLAGGLLGLVLARRRRA